MFARIQSDIQCILDRDPAARSRWEVLTCYPGLHALILHRMAHGCWGWGLRWLGRFVAGLGVAAFLRRRLRSVGAVGSTAISSVSM